MRKWEPEPWRRKIESVRLVVEHDPERFEIKLEHVIEAAQARGEIMYDLQFSQLAIEIEDEEIPIIQYAAVMMFIDAPF